MRRIDTPRTPRFGFIAAAAITAVALLSFIAHAATRTVTAAATLSVLTPVVERVTAGGQRTRATDGMDLAIGDRVVTGGSGNALITFLDGSTVTILPESDIVVRQADVAQRDSSTIGVFINAGTVWARVRKLVDPRSRLSLQSNTATASVHDGLIGAQTTGRGGFECWTQAGDLTIVAADGKTLGTIGPGQMAAVSGGTVARRAFAIHSGTIRVDASPSVLPLVQMPYDNLVGGFVRPGIEVNQVYGSRTWVGSDARRMVEVPGGWPAPYTIVLDGLETGPFEVVVTGQWHGTEDYRLVFRGVARKGERLWTSVNQAFPETGGLAGGHDEITARASGALGAFFRPMRGDLPGDIWLSPREIEAAAR